MKQKKYQILLVLVIISLIGSLALSFSPVADTCGIDEAEGCDVVKNSMYNYSWGIKNSYFGVAISLLLSLLIYAQIKNPGKTKRNIIHLAVIAGAIVALYFIYLQQFVIGSWCTYCLIVDISLLLSLIIIIFNWKK